jgi:hypothetical protein
MRTPSMILNESSILIVGWSKHSWTSHAVLKCEPNPELFATSEKI